MVAAKSIADLAREYHCTGSRPWAERLGRIKVSGLDGGSPLRRLSLRFFLPGFGEWMPGSTWGDRSPSRGLGGFVLAGAIGILSSSAELPKKIRLQPPDAADHDRPEPQYHSPWV
jgi:hypothetical protein